MGVDQQFTVNITTSRCFQCGRFYGYETQRHSGCPDCNTRQVYDLQREIVLLHRRIRGLQSALKRRGRG
jgi:predicted  nucleic acid-binding Zn-ribbon protein